MEKYKTNIIAGERDTVEDFVLSISSTERVSSNWTSTFSNAVFCKVYDAETTSDSRGPSSTFGGLPIAEIKPTSNPSESFFSINYDALEQQIISDSSLIGTTSSTFAPLNYPINILHFGDFANYSEFDLSTVQKGILALALNFRDYHDRYFVLVILKKGQVMFKKLLRKLKIPFVEHG